MKTVLVLLLVLGGAYYYYTTIGFSDADVASIKRQIAEEYEKKPGVKVGEVVLLKKSSRELSGFVKLRHTDINLDQTVRCTAEMGQDRGDSYWRCGQ